MGFEMELRLADHQVVMRIKDVVLLGLSLISVEATPVKKNMETVFSQYTK